MNVQLTLLGGFDVTAGGHSVAPAPRKVKALTAYLGQHANISVPRDQLAELLWGDRSDTRARQSLRQALTVLRQALGDAAEGLQSDNQSVCWSLDTESCDVTEFVMACKTDTVGNTRRALELYRGDLLEGFTARVDAFDEWLAQERMHLADLARQLLSETLQRSDSSIDANNYLNLARRLLQLDPLSETTHRAIMRLHERAGRRDEALRQYEICRRTLATELEVEPDAETSALFQDILRSETATKTAQGSSRASLPDSEPKPEPEAQLRHCVVLAASVNNVVDLDPEILSDSAQLWQREFLDVCNRFGAHVVDSSPSQICAVMGLNRARGDEPLRAARALLQLCQSPYEPGVFQFGYGMAAGQLLLKAANAQPIGSALNVAQQLAGSAGYSEILVAGDLATSLKLEHVAKQPNADAFTLQTLPEDQEKSAQKMIGRQLELQQILAAYTTCNDINCGVTLIVRGEAGMGKTRLLEEAQLKAGEAGFEVMNAQIDESDGDNSALAQLTAKIRGDGSLFTDADIRKEEQWVLQDAMGESATQQTQEFWDSHDSASVSRLRRQAFEKVLKHRTRAGPVVLVIEDIHWADAQMLEVIADLAAITAGSPVLLLLSTRLIGQPLDPVWRSSMEDAAVMVIDLGPLRAPEATALAGHIAHESEHRTRCIERAAGHPLILEQLLRHDSSDNHELPVTIAALVQARLDSLAPEDRAAASAAAILQRNFDEDTLRKLLQQPDYDPTPLLEQRLLKTSSGHLQFVHALIRDAVRDSILASRRTDLHQRAATLFAGNDSRRQLHHLLAAKNEAAVPLCVELAIGAQRNHNLTRALELTQRGLPLAATPAHRHLLALIAGAVNRDLGKHDASLASYQYAQEHASNREELARVQLGQALTLGDMENNQQALELLNPLFDTMEHLPRRLQADIAQARGAQLFAVGRTTKSWWSQQAAMQHAHAAGSPLREARAENGMGDVEYARGNMVAAVSHFARAEALHDEHGFEAGWRAANLATMGMARLFLLEVDAGIANIHHGIQINEEFGYHRMAGFAYCIGGIGHLIRGDYTTALDWAQRAVRACRAQNNRRYQAASLNTVALAHAFLGETESAKAALLNCQALMEAEPELVVFSGPPALVTQAMLAQSSAERQQLCDQADNLCNVMAISHCHFLSRLHAVMLFSKHNENDSALFHARALQEWAGAEQPFARLLLRYAHAHATGNHGDLQQVQQDAQSAGFGALAG